MSLLNVVRSKVGDGLGRFRTDRRGSVGIIFGLAALPILFGFGMGLDYVQASRRHEKLNALADAAALSATTPNMMQQPALVAKANAIALFLSQANQIPGVSVSASNISATVTDTSTSATTVRNVTFTYNAQSSDVFAKLVGKDTIALGGSSVANNATAPNTNFYVLLDSSPSMAIAATQFGIDTMQKNTPKQDNGNGCAFACHQTDPKDDNLGNANGVDNYALARSLNVTLRIDLVNGAAQSMMDYLTTQAGNNRAKYQVASYSFDWQLNKLGDMTDVTVSPTLAKNYASNLQMLTVYKNGWRTSQANDNDQDTDWDNTIKSMNSAMETPGNGTNNLTDKPQEVLMIVTDGVMDESNGGRKIAAMGGSSCTTIKARGIRIAVLYTTYNPLPTNSFYNSNVKPFQPNIGPTLQACATAGLYSVVNTDGDIPSALKTLTSKALTTAHLTQ